MTSAIIILALYILGLVQMMALGNELGASRSGLLTRVLLVVLWPGVIAYSLVWGAYDWLRTNNYV